MIRPALIGLVFCLISACGAPEGDTTQQGLSPEDVRSGTSFLKPETRAMQDDEFANPGYLWVDRGNALFDAGDKPCSTCHDGGLGGIAASYPRIDQTSGELVNLEGQINLCRVRHQGLPPLDYESEDLLSLTAYIANQSKGMPATVSIEGAARPHFENGKAYFFTRRGQYNFSCAQCHDEHWGKSLRADTISQGHLNGYPAYRLEWQDFGSSHRRLRDCDWGVRAEPLDYGDQTYIDVELYLAHRAHGLPLESPAVRR